MRFPEFEGEWEEKKLRGGCRMQAGKFINASGIFDKQNENLFPCYGGNGLRGYAESFNHSGIYSLIGRQGALCGNVTLAKGKFYATEHAIVVKPEKNNDTIWMFYLLSSLNLNQYATGQAQPGLSVQNLEKIEMSLPKSKAEQIKIGAFLSLIDERIATQNKIIEKYESLIKGINEMLFSQKIRFKNSDGGNFPIWESKKMGEIGETFNGLSGKNKDDFGKGKLYIQYKQIFDSSTIQVSNCGLVNVLNEEVQNRVQYGDIFFTTSSETPNEIGMSSVLLNEVDEMFLNSFCFGFRPFSCKILNPPFASYLFRGSVFRNKIVKLAQGSTRYNISKVELMKLSISIPSTKEQIKIADFLSKISNKIETEKQILDKLEKQKKFLLSQMFI